MKVTSVKEDDETEMRMVYDPSHPDADENGYLSGVTFLDVTQLKTTGSEAQRLGRGG